MEQYSHFFKDIPSPAKAPNEFTIAFEDNWLPKDTILHMPDGAILKVLEKPYRKWYKVLLMYLTLGIYRAPWQYNVAMDLETNIKP
jgi:hypothetical protein